MSRRLRQNEGLAGPMVRRSPRLLSRPPAGPANPNPHQLHYAVSSRPTLNSYRTRQHSKSRSASPSTVLDESGQSVPVSFEDTEEVTVSRTRVGSSQREGMPRHLYGLDGDEVGMELLSTDYEPARVWNVYDKERVIQTPPVVHGYSRVNETGFFGRIAEFFTSLLFKLGSFLYLAVTAILCLDVIILHRLFNFASIPQRTGSISRFFILVIALCTLVGFLIGGQFFPAETPIPTPPDYSAFKDRLVQDVMSQVEDNFRVFEANYRRELGSTVDSLIENRASKLSFTLREEMAAEVERIYKAQTKLQEKLTEDITDTVERHSSEVRKSLEGRFSELPGQLEIARKLLAAQIEELKEGQTHLTERVGRIGDETQDKNTALTENISSFERDMIRVRERISQMEELTSNRPPGSAPLNSSVLEDMAIHIFYDELEKATSDRESALRLWMDVIFATKNNLESIHKRIDDISKSSGSLPRQDVQDMISSSLRKFGADRIGKFDFALESSGGSVVLGHCSPTYTHSVSSISLFGIIPLWHVPSTPKVIIQPSLYPGNCWAMEGQHGYATVKLRDEVLITGVTIDHIPRELSPNGTLDSAPKEFSVLGLASLDGVPVVLGNFTYDFDGAPIQQFQIKEVFQMSPYHFVRFEFNSNNGNSNYTCVYRVRVHGRYH